MDKNLGIKTLLIDISLMASMAIGIFLCVRLVQVILLRPFGIPTPQEERTAHSLRFLLEIVSGIPGLFVIGWIGIIVGILLWSFTINLFSLGSEVETLLENRRSVTNLKGVLLWALRKTKVHGKPQ